MSALVALAALPVAVIAILVLFRSPLLGRLVKTPQGERWSLRTTPVGGGIGIYAGLVAGVLGGVAVGAFDPTRELWTLLAGATLLFAAGLADDLRHLPPLAKLALQLAAAGIVVAGGTNVEIVGNDLAASALALLWLVGLTNAFNLLDNMDGLAATLAAIAATFFAVDALTIHPDRTTLVVAIAVAAACVGFLPFNLRLRRPAALYMGDSGSQLLGFTLAVLGLSSSWKVAGTTVATLLLPVLILAVPILDTGLVTVVRILERRPITQGGKDHSSHRLVRYGLSEKHALLLLALVATAVGAASLGYNVLDDQRITLPGLLLTFVLLVQFAGFLADLERRPAAERGGFVAAFDVHWRRLVEVTIDFAVICGAFLAAYVVVFDGFGSVHQRTLFMQTLPVLIAARYLAFIPFGLYRSVWRYAGARDLVAVVAAVAISETAAATFVVLQQPHGLGDFSQDVFVVDALLCMVLVGASRLAERLVRRRHLSRARALPRRVLIVGAGRAGRSLHRELRETPGERVVGFVDDNPRLHRRRLQGIAVRGTLLEMERAIAQTRPDVVLVTIPDAPRERLDRVVAACAAAGIQCRFVRREMDIDPEAVLHLAAE